MDKENDRPKELGERPRRHRRRRVSLNYSLEKKNVISKSNSEESSSIRDEKSKIDSHQRERKTFSDKKNQSRKKTFKIPPPDTPNSVVKDHKKKVIIKPLDISSISTRSSNKTNYIHGKDLVEITSDGRVRKSKDYKSSLLYATSEMANINVSTRARTFEIPLDDKKLCLEKIRGVYVSVDNIALLYVQDVVKALSKMDIGTGGFSRKDMWSSESSDRSSTSESEEEEEKYKKDHRDAELKSKTLKELIESIPCFLKGLEIVYYKGSEKESIILPECPYNENTYIPLMNAKNVYENIIKTPMMRANDVYGRLMKEASIHKQRYIFGLIACIEPYISDSLLLSNIRSIQKRVARDFCNKNQTKGGSTMLPGCIFVKGRCAYWEETRKMRKELAMKEESRQQSLRIFSIMREDFQNITQMNMEYSSMNERLLKEKDEFCQRILELQKTNRKLKKLVEDQENDISTYKIQSVKMFKQIEDLIKENKTLSEGKKKKIFNYHLGSILNSEDTEVSLSSETHNS